MDADEQLIDLATRQASYEFMVEHKDRFDDKLTRERAEAVANIPVGGDSAKVRKGERWSTKRRVAWRDSCGTGRLVGFHDRQTYSDYRPIRT